MTTKNTTPLEDEECILLHQWLEIQHIPHAHIANESRSSNRNAMIRGAKLKRMGQKSGVWDYEIFLPIKGITGNVDAYQEVRIEMKRQKGGTVSDAQKDWKKIYDKAGIPCAICKGFEEAKKYIETLRKEIGA